MATLQPPAGQRTVGDTQLFASVEADRHPESATVVGDTVYVGTTAPLQEVGVGKPSRIYAFDRRSGAQRYHLTVEGENTSVFHGIAGLTVDDADRLYAVDVQGRILRFAKGPQATQEVYATIPDLPPCVPHGPSPCSPTRDDRPAFANDVAFDRDGNLYVSDSWQATIFRVPPGGGAAEVWFQDQALDGVVGVNGLAASPDGGSLYVTVTGDAQDVASLYLLPLDADDRSLQLVSRWPGGGADGVVVGASGKLYITLFAYNQIAIVSPDGNEQRISHPTFDEPARLAFDDRRGALIVPNHALLNPRPERRLIVTVYVDDRGAPLT